MLRANLVLTKKNHLKGFTLVEILISLAILAMIVVSTFTIFRSSTKSWQKGVTRSERYHNARIAMGKMSAEISQAVLGEDSRSRFSGEKKEIRFLSFISSAAEIFELAEIEYWLDEDGKVLMRNEDVNPDYDFLTQDESDILASNVSELEFSYHDGSDWKDTWDSDLNEENKLPKAVKVKIKIEDKKGRESETFEIIASLKTAS